MGWARRLDRSDQADRTFQRLLRGCLKSPDSRQILSNMCSLQLPDSWDEAYTAFCELGIGRTFQTSSKKSNISIIVIDHNYTHLFEICDRINVIQHGQVTVDKSLSEIKLEELIEFMVQSFRRDVATGGAK